MTFIDICVVAVNSKCIMFAVSKSVYILEQAEEQKGHPHKISIGALFRVR